VTRDDPAADVGDVALLDGEPVDAGALRLGAFASGFFFGCGLFETIALERGEPRLLERHLARLRRGLEALPVVRGPREPRLLEAGSLRAGIALALARRAAPPPDAAKLVVCDGRALVTFRHALPDVDARRRDGVDVDDVDGGAYRSGDPLANHKTLSYLRSYSAARRDVLFANERGELCEAPTANVFVAFEGRVVTPPASAPCLPGVVREVLLEAGALAGRPVVEAPLPLAALAGVRGCFLTNAVAVAVPVRRLLGRPLAESAALAAAARELVGRAAG
jgi:branched-chain amino acid aminotransferase